MRPSRTANPSNLMETTSNEARLPSDALLRRLQIVFSAIGLLVAIYLIYIKFYPASTLCVGTGGCEAVNTSAYSEIRGVPIAIFGALAYAFLLATLLFEKRAALVTEWGPMLVFGVSLIGVLYSAYLTYIEVAVLHAICPYCVTSAVMLTLIFILSIFRIRRYL